MIISNKLDSKIFRALTIAGSDSGGGAGIQADLKTFAANGVYGTSVITAITAQNTRGVASIHAVPADFVGAQLNAVLSDIGTDAVKIGMLFDPDIIRAVAEKLRHYDCKNIVVDPVMVAKSGDRLLKTDAIDALKKHLFPLATVITPNLPEAGDLLGIDIKTRADMQEAARHLLEFGSASVIIKGGHLEADSSADYFLCSNNPLPFREGSNSQSEFGGGLSKWFEQPRIETNNNHGTGCTFSSAIAAHLAKGYPLLQAIENAKTYLTAALHAGADYKIGNGHGPVDHFYAMHSQL